MGMIAACQSEDVPLGLLFIFSRAVGNKITKNITNANAEAICIQSISKFLLSHYFFYKQNPGLTGVLNSYLK